MAKGWILLVLGSLLLAGCADPDVGPQQRRSAAGRGTLDLPADPNAVPHVHDEWGNATRMLVAHSRISGSSSGSSTDRRSFPYSPSKPIITGAAELLVTVHFNQTGGDPAELTFDYLPAGHSEWRNYSFEFGRPFSIIVQPDWADPPHSRSSYWRFALGMHFRSSEGGSISFNSNTTVEILRVSGELPKDPAHPEQWFGATVTSLFDAAGPLKDGAAPGPQSPPPRFLTGMKAVPWNTSRVEITLFYNSTTPPELHYAPTMSIRAHGGSQYTYDFEDVPANESSTGASGFHRWTWNVDESNWDSPYADGSLWGLEFRWAGLLPTPICCFERPAEMDGDFHLAIEAFRG